MSISSKRFEFLDKETNLAISDFVGSDNTGILNNASNALETISEEVSGFISKHNIDTSKLELAKDTVIDELDAITRSVKGSMSDIVDIKQLPNIDIAKKIKEITGDNPIVSNIIDSMSVDCKSNAVNKRNKEIGFSPELDCNGKKRSSEGDCNVELFGDAISKLSDGSFSFSFSDPSSIMDRLLSLSSMGYKMNLCGVFNALSPGVDVNILSKVSSGLLSNLNGIGDINGILDLANSSGGLHTKLFQSSIAKNIMSNINIEGIVSEKNMSSMTDRLMGAMTILEDTWEKSGFDNILTSNEVDNPDATKLFKAKTMDASYTPLELDVAPNTDEAYIYTAMA